MIDLVNVHSVFQQLGATSSSNAKLDILRSNADNQNLKTVLYFALSGEVNFWLVPPPLTKLPPPGTQETIEEDHLKLFTQRQVTGNAAKDTYQRLMSILTPEAQIVLHRLMSRDPKCGVAAGLVNKVWEGLIWEFQLMLAESTDDYPKIATVGWQADYKLDGLRCQVQSDRDGVVNYLSRSGKPLYNLGFLTPEIVSLGLPLGTILDCEIADDTWNSSASLARSSKTEKQSDTAVLYVFDLLTPGLSHLTFGERRARLETLIKDTKRIRLCPTFGLVRDGAHQDEISREAVEKGFEGLVLKNPKSTYQLRRSVDWLKYKPTDTTDVEIIGFQPGKPGTKYEHMLGAFEVRRKSGVQFNVGGGLSDAQRVEFWNIRATLLHTIIEITEDYVPAARRHLLKARFPRFNKLRIGDKASL